MVKLKVHSMTKKVPKLCYKKCFFLHLLFDNLPSLFSKTAYFFISILKLLNFHSRNHRRANFIENVSFTVDTVQNFRWELNLFLISSIKDIYAKRKCICSNQSNILNYIEIKVYSLYINVRNFLAINHTITQTTFPLNFKCKRTFFVT